MREPTARSGADPDGRICHRCGDSIAANIPGNLCAQCSSVSASNLSTQPYSRAVSRDSPVAAGKLCVFCGRELEPDVRGDVCGSCLQSTHPDGQATSTSQRGGDGSDLLRGEQELGHGKFTLKRRLGVGGMGQVWLAVDNSLSRAQSSPHFVALKFLAARLAANKRARERLREEVLRGFQMNHDHIIRIHSWHEDSGEPVYYAMEYAEGETLSNRADKLPGQRFSWIELAPIAKQLCEALAYAHARGVIHRDLKPGNILLTSNNVVKLADFGLAQSILQKSDSSSTTHPGGTPGYMSPQQSRGEPSKAADDIYALGATLYKALTGATPFVQDGVMRPLAEVLRQFRNHDVPPNVIQTITICLAEKPDDRPASVEEVSQRLGFYTSWEGDTVQLKRPRPRRAIVAVSIVAICLAAAGLAYWFSRPSPKVENSHSPQTSTVTPPVTQSKADGAGIQVRLVSPEKSGRLVAPANITLDAAVTPSNAIVKLVLFQTNNVTLYEVGGPPFRYAWERIPAGTYEITAVATDDKGTKSRSASVTIVVASLQPVRGQPWTNTLGMEFLPLPGGEGWLCKHDTRVRDYAIFNTSHYSESLKYAAFPQSSDKEPVILVNWLGAEKFCQSLTRRERESGLITPQQRYRLPNVAEWRAALGSAGAARTGFLWGAETVPPARIGNFRGKEWRRKGGYEGETLNGYEDGVFYTAPVGSFDANENGFYDLIGNVWQMCEKAGGSHGNLVAVGGAWDTSDLSQLRASFELPLASDKTEHDNIGFRCILVEEPAGQQK